MYGDSISSCACIGVCSCGVPRFLSATSLGMTSLPPKDDAGAFDTDENQHSEGEGKKRTNSGSPSLVRKLQNNLRRTSSSSNIKPRATAITSAPTEASQRKGPDEGGGGGRSFLFESQKLHVLQPHSHRRHYTHHLLDHFSSEELLVRHEKTPRRKVWQEIKPSLESCEYKDTNFLTEGSPPRVATPRRFMASHGLSVKEDQNGNPEIPQTTTKTAHLPASIWKEPPEVARSGVNEENNNAWPDVVTDSGSQFANENDKNLQYLDKFKYESVRGPQQGSASSGKYRLPSRTPPSVKDKQNVLLNPGYVKSCVKAWNWQSPGERFGAVGRRAPKFRDADGKTYSNRAKEAKETESMKEGSIQSSGAPNLTALRSCFKPQRKQPKILRSPKSSTCQACLSRKTSRRDANVQTENRRVEFQMTQESQTDPKSKGLDKSQITDFTLQYAVPQYSDSSESNEYSCNTTDDTSSITFDDDDFCNLGSPDRKTDNYFKGDILGRIKYVQSKILGVRGDMTTLGSKETSDYVGELLAEVREIVSEMYELYDDFDTDEKEEQSEFNELKKQLQQYKRTCRVLEYELMSADSKSGDNSQTAELQEEIRMSRHVAVSLNWELQSADEKVKKIDAENNQYRQKLTSCEIQRHVLEKEVIALRNAVDQMSLHASAVPANDGEAVKSRNALPELQRQIQFQEEERKAILFKLVETDKEKDRLEELVNRYSDKYGEIGSLDRTSTEEEWKYNDLRIRIRMAEDQSGVLGRKVMQLQLENENLSKQIAEKKTVDTVELARKPSSSDLQFLEDEVEALRMTLEEMEEENKTLRNNLNQSEERAMKSEKKIQIFQETQTSLKELVTPTTSDKIAAWEVSNPGSPTTIRSDSDVTISGIEFDVSRKSGHLVRTAFDATTQTVAEIPAAPPFRLPLLREKAKKSKPSPIEISKELIEILKGSEDVDVEFVVSQLTNLAIATRHLVDESPSNLTHHTAQEYSPMFEQNPKLLSPFQCFSSSSLQQMPVDVPVDHTTNYSAFRLLVLSVLIYMIMTSLPAMTLCKFIFLSVIFLLI